MELSKIKLTRRELGKYAGIAGLSSLFAHFLAPIAAATPKSPGTITWAELGAPGELFTISGVPSSIEASKIVKFANRAPNPGDVPHVNDVKLGSEIILAQPGGRYTLGWTKGEGGKLDWDVEAIEKGEAYLLTPDKQRIFVTDPYEFPLIEGGFAQITGDHMDLSFPGPSGDIKIHLGGQSDLEYIVLVRGFARDNTKRNLNKRIIATNHDKAYTQGIILPPNQFVSINQFKNNVLAAHNVLGAKNNIVDTGTDVPVSGVTALFINAQDGAYTLINQATPTAQWKLLQSNIKTV